MSRFGASKKSFTTETRRARRKRDQDFGDGRMIRIRRDIGPEKGCG
jgi:hypothetical protein